MTSELSGWTRCSSSCEELTWCTVTPRRRRGPSAASVRWRTRWRRLSSRPSAAIRTVIPRRGGKTRPGATSSTRTGGDATSGPMPDVDCPTDELGWGRPPDRGRPGGDAHGGQERVFETLLQHYPAADAVALRFPASRPYSGREPHCAERVRGLRTPGERRSLLMPLYAGRMALARRIRAEVVLSITRAAPRPARGHVAQRATWHTARAPHDVWPERVLARGRAPGAATGFARRTPTAGDLPTACSPPDRLITNSAYSSQYLQRERGLDTEVIHPPVRTDFFTPAPRERRHGWPWPPHLPEALRRPHGGVRLGRRDPGGGRRRPGAGPAGGGRAAERRLPRLRPRPELRELTGPHTASICPSLETFGLVMAEALGCGTPVIAQRAGGAVELIREGVNGAFLGTVDAVGVPSAIAEVEQGSSRRRGVPRIDRGIRAGALPGADRARARGRAGVALR